MINRNRLAKTFTDLVRIDSVAKKEGAIAKALCDMLKSLGAEVLVDNAGEKIGSDTGNIIAKFKGTEKGAPPLLLNAHIDTVKPGDVVALIEAMKVFNDLKTEAAGKVVRVLIENGKPVSITPTFRPR